MILGNEEAEKRAILQTADMMAAAARTAPKACGIDNLEVLILDGADKDRLAAEMRRLGNEFGTGMEFMVRDGNLVDISPVVLLFGARTNPAGLGNACGFCGFKNCAENIGQKASCAFNTIDLGIAIGSAVSVAADHRIDNRVLYSAGKAALNLGLFADSVKAALGIPLSVSSKNPFFDRESGDNQAISRGKK